MRLWLEYKQEVSRLLEQYKVAPPDADHMLWIIVAAGYRYNQPADKVARILVDSFRNLKRLP